MRRIKKRVNYRNKIIEKKYSSRYKHSFAVFIKRQKDETQLFYLKCLCYEHKRKTHALFIEN